jgi:hypothetical protein
MTWQKIVLRLLLVVVLIFDLSLGLEFYRHGLPVDMQGRSLSDGRMQVSVTKLSMSPIDWAVLLALIAVEAAIVYANWRLVRGGRTGRTLP